MAVSKSGPPAALALMRPAFRSAVFLTLVLVNAVAALGRDAAGDASLGLTVQVFNRAGVEHDTLLSAEGVAQRIFAKAGVQLRFVDASEGEAREVERKALLAAEIQVNILSQQLSEEILYGVRAPRNMMGMTPCKGTDCRMAYVFYNIVQDTVTAETSAFEGADAVKFVALRVTPATILGHAMAHEIAHVLNQEHSDRGLMRAGWDSVDLQNAGFGKLLFTARQAAGLRAEAARRNQELSTTEIARFKLSAPSH